MLRTAVTTQLLPWRWKLSSLVKEQSLTEDFSRGWVQIQGFIQSLHPLPPAWESKNSGLISLWLYFSNMSNAQGNPPAPSSPLMIALKLDDEKYSTKCSQIWLIHECCPPGVKIQYIYINYFFYWGSGIGGFGLLQNPAWVTTILTPIEKTHWYNID